MAAWCLIGAVWLLLFPYNQQLNNPNERTRVLQARALAEYGQWHIGEAYKKPKGGWRYRDLYGRSFRDTFVNDVALVCADEQEKPPRCAGKIYPAKAPGTSLLGVPALWAASGMGIVDRDRASEPRVTWILRVFGVALPLWLMLGFWAGFLARQGLHRDVLRRGLLAVGLGTGVFAYALHFVGHALAGAALTLGAILLGRATAGPEPKHRWAAAAGAALASAVFFEYHAAFAVVALSSLLLFSRDGRRVLPAFAMGALPLALAHLALHALLFRDPLATGHVHLLTAHNLATQSEGFLGLGGFNLESLGAYLGDPYMGWLPTMPWMILAGVPGLWAGMRRSGGKGPGLTWRCLVAACLVYLAFTLSLNNVRGMNGWSVGPRYLLPATLPLATLAVLAWHQYRQHSGVDLLFRSAAAVGVLVVGAVVVVFPQPPDGVRGPFSELALPLLLEGYSVRTMADGLLGTQGAFGLYLLLMAAGLWGIVSGPGLRLTGRTLGSAALALIWVVGLSFWWPSTAERRLEGQRFVRTHAEGRRPPRGHKPPADTHPLLRIIESPP